MDEKKITLFSGSGKRFQTISLTQIVEKIRTGDDPAIRKLKEGRYTLSWEKMEQLEEKILRIGFSSLYRRESNRNVWNSYTGLVLVELDHLPGYDEARKLQHAVAQSLQTLLTFISLSGRTLYVVVAFTLPDGNLPQEWKAVELFHAHAYRRAVRYLSTQLNCYIEEKKPDPETFCRMSSNKTIWFNPEALPIRMEQPLQPLAEPTLDEKLAQEEDPIQRMYPGRKRSRAIWSLYNHCHDKVIDLYGASCPTDSIAFLVKLAEECCRTRVPEEDMLKFTLFYSAFANQETEVRETVRNVYRRMQVSNKKEKYRELDAPTRLHLKFLEFLKRRYLFRYNVLKECVEYYRYRSFSWDFVPVTQREMNGICVDAHDEGLFIWDRDLRRYLESNRVPLFDPLQNYLSELPPWDGKDHIRALAGRIHTPRCEWVEQFYKWFLYMVAQWTTPDELHANSTVPVLIGKQGYHKSTFCKMILPPELRDYYKEQIDIRKKREVDWALSRFALINLDEFDSIRPADHTQLKHILQKTEVFEKDRQSGADIRKKRIASFIATCNSFDVLSDPTGSRRYICLELTSDFDLEPFPDYAQLYAQAKNAIQKGEQYWFTREEEAEIVEGNQEFQQIPLPEELFLLYFRRAEPDEEHEILTSTEILMRLKKLSKAGFEVNQTTKIRFFASMKKLGVLNHRLERGSGYRVKQIRFE